MREVDYQKFVLDIVREAGGAGHKLSNRFLVGVSDLLIKLPGREAALIEVKLAKFSLKTPDHHGFDLEVTQLQYDFLKKYRKAGMKATGVLSFVEQGRQRLRIGMFRLDTFSATGYTASIGAHQLLNWPKRREKIHEMLEDFTR